MDLLFLADGTDPEKVIGWGERLIQGGVPLICIAVAAAAVAGLVIQLKRNAKLEADYRADLDNRAKKAEGDAEKRLTEAKNESKERASEVDKFHRERLQAEKEGDQTLAQAVRVIEANTAKLERIDKLEQVLERLVDRLERRSS